MMRHLTITGLVIIICAVTACGFQLRGAYNLPKNLSPLYLDRASMSQMLYKELRTTLKASGAELTDDPATAASELKISLEKRTRDVTSVDTLGRAREYRLMYHLVFTMKTQEATVIENSRIKLSRNLLFNPEAVLGRDLQIEDIYKDMIHDSAGQILLRLQALN
jgi:LPS-assembly lipoprotein